MRYFDIFRSWAAFTFVSKGTVSSKICNDFSELLMIIISGFNGVGRMLAGMVPPLVLYPGMSAKMVNLVEEINFEMVETIWLKMLSCLQVYLP